MELHDAEMLAGPLAGGNCVKGSLYGKTGSQNLQEKAQSAGTSGPGKWLHTLFLGHAHCPGNRGGGSLSCAELFLVQPPQ